MAGALQRMCRFPQYHFDPTGMCHRVLPNERVVLDEEELASTEPWIIGPRRVAILAAPGDRAFVIKGKTISCNLDCVVIRHAIDLAVADELCLVKGSKMAMINPDAGS